MPKRSLLAVLVAFLVAAPAAAQEWRAPAAAARALGVRAMTCTGEFCLGVACGRGGAEFVAVAAGGGPFNGATEVVVAETRASVAFREDDALTQAFGMIGARAPAPPPLLAAMAGAQEIALSGPTYSDPLTMRFSLKGYAALAAGVARGCGD